MATTNWLSWQLSNIPTNLSYETNKHHRLHGENTQTYSNRLFSLGNQIHTHNSGARRSVDPITRLDSGILEISYPIFKDPSWLVLLIVYTRSQTTFLESRLKIIHPLQSPWTLGIRLKWHHFTTTTSTRIHFPFSFFNRKRLSLLFLFSLFGNKVYLSYLNFVIWNNNDPYKFKTIQTKEFWQL